MNQSSERSILPPVPTESPAMQCDVIMKGGITSGVVYPWAMAEFAMPATAIAKPAARK